MDLSQVLVVGTMTLQEGKWRLRKVETLAQGHRAFRPWVVLTPSLLSFLRCWTTVPLKLLNWECVVNAVLQEHNTRLSECVEWIGVDRH